MLIKSGDSIAKQFFASFKNKAVSYIWMSSAGLSTPALKIVLLIGYFFVVVFCAKQTDPEFMGKSIGIVDSVFRAYIVSFFQAITGNLNPFYISFALYPFGIYACWLKGVAVFVSSKKGQEHFAQMDQMKLTLHDLK